MSQPAVRWWADPESGIPESEWSLYDDFRVFLWLIWQHLNLPEPTPVQYDVARYLQHGPRRKVIMAFRGVGKSWVTSAFVCWLLLRDPQTKILVVSASKTRADDFTTFTLRLIKEVPILRHLTPREGQRDSKIAFDVGPAQPDHSPSVKSVGITGQLSGSRADHIIPDDIEVPNNSATQMMRDKLAESVKEFDAILKPGGFIHYLGTPQTEQSVYLELEQRGYEIRIWPARVPEDKLAKQYGPKLAPFIRKLMLHLLPRSPTDPRRFTEEDLWEREISYGKAGFSLQFMLDTSLSDAERYPLKLSDLIVTALDNQKASAGYTWGATEVVNDVATLGLNGDRYYRPIFSEAMFLPYTGAIMAIDPSGRGTDETGYAIVKFLHGTLFLVAAGGFRDGYSTATLEALATLAYDHSVNGIITEPNFGDGMFNELFKPVLGRIFEAKGGARRCSIEETERSTSQKEKRIIDSLEPVLMQHRLVIDERVIRDDYKSIQDYPTEKKLYYSLFYQLTRITKDRGAIPKYDRLDALAMAVHYWTEKMARDSQVALKDHLEELRRKELEKFMFAAGVHAGGSPGRNGWTRRR